MSTTDWILAGAFVTASHALAWWMGRRNLLAIRAERARWEASNEDLMKAISENTALMQALHGSKAKTAVFVSRGGSA